MFVQGNRKNGVQMMVDVRLLVNDLNCKSIISL